jgi:hypothetical protein
MRVIQLSIYCGLLSLAISHTAISQDVISETDQKGYSFFEPSVKVSEINNKAGILGGAKFGYAFRNKYSVGIAYSQLFSPNVTVPNNGSGWSDKPFARYNSLVADFEYIAFQINSIDLSINSSYGIARASYNHSTVDSHYFMNQYYHRIETGVSASKQLLNRLQLRFGAAYGLLLNDEDVHYSMPGLGGPNEGTLPFQYQGFSLNLNVRLTLNRYY